MKPVHIIFLDGAVWNELLPLTFTRPVAEIRTGILSVREKWVMHLNAGSFAYKTQEYLSGKYAFQLKDVNLFIDGALLPDNNLVAAIEALKPGEMLCSEDKILAALLAENDCAAFLNQDLGSIKKLNYSEPFNSIKHFCNIFSLCDIELKNDFEILTHGRKSAALSSTNRVTGSHSVFLEEGAKVECSTINTENGPVYIGRDAEVMEGCLIRGPFALGEHSVLKMGAKIYGATSIGSHSKVGGEINNSVIFGYSNKAHDGFLGNSVIGEWVNLGADTNNSNLKNNYASVKMWNYNKKSFVNTGLTFAGLIMGDHSKCGINTMFNTGTVIGVSCNLFGDGFHRNFVPSFSWGGPSGYVPFKIDKALEVARNMMGRRGLELNEEEIKILTYLSQNIG